jgi:hypothetical protein
MEPTGIIALVTAIILLSVLVIVVARIVQRESVK